MTWDVFLRRLAAGETIGYLTAAAGVPWPELIDALTDREWRELTEAAELGRQAMLRAQVPA